MPRRMPAMFSLFILFRHAGGWVPQNSGTGPVAPAAARGPLKSLAQIRRHSARVRIPPAALPHVHPLCGRAHIYRETALARQAGDRAQQGDYA